MSSLIISMSALRDTSPLLQHGHELEFDLSLGKNRALQWGQMFEPALPSGSSGMSYACVVKCISAYLSGSRTAIRRRPVPGQDVAEGHVCRLCPG